MAAATCVFETYELLERTLLHLPLRDLLLVERVCQTWQGIIHKSHTIGRALFRQPVRFDARAEWKSDSFDLRTRYLNPFLDSFVDRLSPRLQLRHTLIERDEQAAVRTAFYSEIASWRCMLLLQPPPTWSAMVCKRLELLEPRTNPLDRFIRMRPSPWHQVKDVSMGYICQVMFEHLQICPDCPTIENDIYELESQKVPAWSMACRGEKPSTLSLGMTGWECMEQLGGYK